MIKWFCDWCKKEIEAPEHPVFVTAFYQSKNRNNPGSGWGTDNQILKICCNVKCAEEVCVIVKRITIGVDKE